MTQIVWIARHGNRLDFVTPEWFNDAKRRYDPPLSEDGLIQAKQLGKRLKSEKITHIFSSPFLRAIQTANQVAEALDLSIKLEAGLGEWLNPNWMTETPEIHPPEILKKQYPRIDWSYDSCVIPSYPESDLMVNQRIGETARKLLLKFSENILLVGHSTSVLGITSELLGETVKVETPLCCLVKIVKDKQQWKMELNGDTSHLTNA